MTGSKNQEAVNGIKYMRCLLSELEELLISKETRVLSEEEHARIMALISEYRNCTLPSSEERDRKFVPLTGGSFTSVLFSVGQDSYLYLKLREKEDEKEDEKGDEKGDEKEDEKGDEKKDE